MSLKYRFLAVDVDGTLLNSRNELPEAHRAALHKAHEAGITVCLCTGRTLTETRVVIEELGLDSDAGVFVFGAIVSRLPSGETLHRTTIPGPLAGRLAAFFQARDYPVLILFDARQVGLDYYVTEGSRNSEDCQRWMELSPTSAERIKEWKPGGYEPVRIGVIDDPNHISETMASLQREFPAGQIKCNSIYVPGYGLHVVECFAPQVNKWYGIMRLADTLSINGSQIAAIGDDINDLDMIRQAGLGVSMGNAIEPIKAAANWQAPTNDAGGVATTVEAILSGQFDNPVPP